MLHGHLELLIVDLAQVLAASNMDCAARVQGHQHSIHTALALVGLLLNCFPYI